MRTAQLLGRLANQRLRQSQNKSVDVVARYHSKMLAMMMLVGFGLSASQWYDKRLARCCAIQRVSGVMASVSEVSSGVSVEGGFAIKFPHTKFCHSKYRTFLIPPGNHLRPDRNDLRCNAQRSAGQRQLPHACSPAPLCLPSRTQ